MPVDIDTHNIHKSKYLSRFIAWLNDSFFSVSTKLNIVNVLVIISGVLSIIGAYEIQMGGRMHELNYLHQKYITQVVQSVKEFESDRGALISVENDIILIQQQPLDCLALVGPIEEFMMSLIKTDNAIRVCQNDILIADEILQKIRDYRLDKISKVSLLTHLHQSIKQFEENGAAFEPLVARTVKIIFFIVISIVIGKAFIVPIFGLLLSRSVARDYKVLAETKTKLEEEKEYSALIQSERMASLTTLVAGIAHEINTPVGVSITASSHSNELLHKIKKSYEAEQLTEEDLCHFFTEIEKTNEIVSSNLLRTSTLVKSFKMVSVDQTIEELQTINIKDYIEEVLISLSPLTKKSNMEVKLHCEEALKIQIHSDSFIQIITNIITNAMDHAFKGKKHGTLTISISKKNAREVLASFEDDGHGISKEDQLHIFEPFFTTGRGSGNTGLGLHILHNLVVDKLKGHISCFSKINQGTRFDIYLPIDPTTDPTTPTCDS